MNRRNELIAASRYGDDEAGFGRDVSERAAQRKDALAESAFLDGRRRPHGFHQPGLVEQLAGVGDHVEQHVERARRQLDHAIRAAELARRSIEVKFPELEGSHFDGVAHNEKKSPRRTKNRLTKKANPVKPTVLPLAAA